MDTPPPATLAGERTVPGIAEENYWFRRHEAAYLALDRWVTTDPGLVVDAGCGEGYSADLLHRLWSSASVLGVDYDGAATAHAAARYGAHGSAFLRAALTALPLPSSASPVTISLQVLEHIWTPGEYVRELVRVSRPGAVVVLSTPNRLTFSPGAGRRSRPANPYHCREYDPQELRDELGRWVPGQRTQVLGLHHSPRLAHWEEVHGPVVAALIAREPQDWTPDLTGLVESVTAADFEIGAADDDCQDLIAVLTTAD